MPHRPQAVRRRHRLEVAARVEDRDGLALGDVGERVVLGEHVARLVDVPGDRHAPRPRPERVAHREDLLGEPVDEVRAVDVPADVEADERRVAAPLDAHDLAQQHGRVLHHEVAGLERRDDAVRAEVPRHDLGVRVEVDGPLVLRGPARPSPPPTLTSRIAKPASASRSRNRVARTRAALEPVQLVAEPAGPRVEVERVHDEPVAAARVDRVVEAVLGHAELGRAIAGVGEVLRVARAGARVDPDPDRPPGRPPPEPLELAHAVEVDPDRVREQDVEVALGDVRARVADLRRAPSRWRARGSPRPASRRRCRRCSGAPGRAEAAQHREDPRVRAGLEREPDDVRGRPARVERALERADVLARAARGRRRTAARRARASSASRSAPLSASRPSTTSSPGRRHQVGAAATGWTVGASRGHARARRCAAGAAGRRGSRRRVTGSANGSGPVGDARAQRLEQALGGVGDLVRRRPRTPRRSSPTGPGTR